MKAYQIKITVKHSVPQIWRRVIIPAQASFQGLHDLIQTVFNFKSGYPNSASKSFQFEIGSEKLKITNDEEAYQMFQEFQQDRAELEEALLALNTSFARKQLASMQTEVQKPDSLLIEPYVEKYGVLGYLYDFDSEWEIELTLEEKLKAYEADYPTLLAGAEAAPPENVGGLAKYYSFLEVYQNPEHEDYLKARAWAEEQGYRKYDPESINECLKLHNLKR